MFKCGRFAVLLLIALLAVSFAEAQTLETYSISILKGPSGMAAAWMMKDSPVVEGAALRFVIAGGADIATAKLVSGEIQAAVLPLNVAAKLYNAGVGIKAMAVVGNGMVKFLSSNPAIRSIEDIRGRDIHIAGQKATPDYLFRYLTGQSGLIAGTDYIARYSLAYPEIAAQLAAGRIEAAVLPEPFATQALTLNSSLKVAVDLDYLWKNASGLENYPMSLFVVTNALANSRTGVMRAIEKAYKASIEKTITEPVLSAILIESLDLGMKAPVAEAAIPRSAYVYQRARDAKASIEAILSLFLASDPVSVGGKLPDPAFYL